MTYRNWIYLDGFIIKKKIIKLFKKKGQGNPLQDNIMVLKTDSKK